MTREELLEKLESIPDHTIDQERWSDLKWGAKLGHCVPGDILLEHVNVALPPEGKRRDLVLGGESPQHVFFGTEEHDIWLTRGEAIARVDPAEVADDSIERDDGDADVFVGECLHAQQVAEAMTQGKPCVVPVAVDGQPPGLTTAEIEMLPEIAGVEYDVIAATIKWVYAEEPQVDVWMEPTGAIEGRDVILVFYAVTAGVAEKALRDDVLERGARSVRVYTYVDEVRRRVVDVKIDGSVFRVEPVLTYGIATAGDLAIPYIGVG